MTVHRLADLTWEDVRALDRERLVAILPVGATEAHGPHLPLDTDVTIALAMAEAGAERLARRGVEVVLLEPLAYTPARFAASFPGTINIAPGTSAALLTDIATSLHRGGIGMLAIANSHFDPEHLAAVHDAASAINERGLMCMVFPDVTRRPWGSRLTDEFKSGACHAGQYEGSIVLARSPERVREAVLRGLEDNPVSLSAAIADGVRSFAEAGGPRAYFGTPAGATAEEGRATIDVLGQILEEAVMEALGIDAREGGA